MRWTGLALVLAGCGMRDGAVQYRTLESAAEQRPMTYATYTPPGWDGVTPLPLVVFLHGGGDDHTVLHKHSVVVRKLDAWIEAGDLPPLVMVAPDGKRGFWRNWDDGSHRFVDWVMEEVVPDVRATYPLLPAPEGQHLMGISMGGAGAIYIGLDHLDQFGSITSWSAPIFDAEGTQAFLENPGFVGKVAPFDRVFGSPDPEHLAATNAFSRLMSEDDLNGTDLLIGYGTIDIFGIPRAMKAYHEHLEAHAVPHDYVVYKGGHRWVDWAEVFPVALCLHLDAACALPPSKKYTLEAVPTSP